FHRRGEDHRRLRLDHPRARSRHDDTRARRGLHRGGDRVGSVDPRKEHAVRTVSLRIADCGLRIASRIALRIASRITSQTTLRITLQTTLRITGVAAVVTLSSPIVDLQSTINPQSPELKILSPGEEAYVSGPTLLRAEAVPADAIAGVTFFVDGRQACALVKVPFECDWDAGATVAEHQVRAVATLKSGGRIVHTVRTKSIGYAERVD